MTDKSLSWSDRQLPSRVDSLEEKYRTIITRLDAIDVNVKTINMNMKDIEALKNQITGMVNLVRFVGIGGVLACGAVLIKYLMTVKP